MGSDPEHVHTLPELIAALQDLRCGRSYADLNRAARTGLGLAREVDPLPTSTLSDLFGGKAVPSRRTVTTLLAACGLGTDEAQTPWLAAWERVGTAHLARPRDAIRVRDARPRLLGVHAAIRVDDAPTELPAYVPRDLDADLRAALTAAAGHGGLVLLVGRSSVGKTRALFEAVRAVVPEWWLVHPADAGEVAGFAGAPTPRTVVWLDELQRYLDGGLSAAVVRGLITARVLLAATLWPHEYGARTVPRLPGQPDAYSNDRELLGFAHVIDVPDGFSAAERRRAEVLATDPRIRIALDSPDAGFTQVLAAGPELVRWWESAPDRYGQAVITAALDARRVGTQAPLSPALLAAAAPAYLTSAEQATAPPDWLDRAIGYAITQLHGATATLSPVPAGMSRVAGYTVADYLHQHARRVRRTVQLPDRAWQALVDHHDPDDAIRLGDSAARRGRYRFAEALYRRAADEGDRRGVLGLIDLLADRNQTGRLRRLAAAGDPYAAARLADLLAEQGRAEDALAVFRALADAGDQDAEVRLADLLAEHGRVEELRERAGTGHPDTALRLAELLADRGGTEEALVIFGQRAQAGDPYATVRFADLLAAQGRTDDALVIFRRRAEAGDAYAAGRLDELLAAQDRLDELRRRIDAGDPFAAGHLARRLADQGRTEDALTVFRQLAGAGDGYAANRLADLLAAHGRLDEALVHYRRLAEGGNNYAADRLDALIPSELRIDELRRAAAGSDAGGAEPDPDAADRLADLLARHGRTDEALAIFRGRTEAGDPYAADRLDELLAERGRIDELRQRADAGDPFAAGQLAGLLADQGRLDELRAEVAAGTVGAARRLAEAGETRTGES
jgi:hypothetical protein